MEFFCFLSIIRKILSFIRSRFLSCIFLNQTFFPVMNNRFLFLLIFIIRNFFCFLKLFHPSGAFSYGFFLFLYLLIRYRLSMSHFGQRRNRPFRRFALFFHIQFLRFMFLWLLSVCFLFSVKSPFSIWGNFFFVPGIRFFLRGAYFRGCFCLMAD